MVELPTDEKLKLLYNKHGQDTVTWYSWRNALRALPLPGDVSLREIWLKQTVQHIYSVCRVNILLSNKGQSLPKGTVTGVDVARAITADMAHDFAAYDAILDVDDGYAGNSFSGNHYSGDDHFGDSYFEDSCYEDSHQVDPYLDTPSEDSTAVAVAAATTRAASSLKYF